MSRKLSYKKMIRRIMRVAEILAKVETQNISDNANNALVQNPTDKAYQSDREHTKN